MFSYQAAIQGGLAPLGAASVTLSTSASTPFADAPAGTIAATVTIRTNPATLTFDGTTPVAGATGHDFGVGTYDLTLSRAFLRGVRAIGSATLYVTYWGLN